MGGLTLPAIFFRRCLFLMQNSLRDRRFRSFEEVTNWIESWIKESMEENF